MARSSFRLFSIIRYTPQQKRTCLQMLKRSNGNFTEYVLLYYT